MESITKVTVDFEKEQYVMIHTVSREYSETSSNKGIPNVIYTNYMGDDLEEAKRMFDKYMDSQITTSRLRVAASHIHIIKGEPDNHSKHIAYVTIIYADDTISDPEYLHTIHTFYLETMEGTPMHVRKEIKQYGN